MSTVADQFAATLAAAGVKRIYGVSTIRQCADEQSRVLSSGCRTLVGEAERYQCIARRDRLHVS
jgi:hypothetical protein